jgi:MFS family permease
MTTEATTATGEPTRLRSNRDFLVVLAGQAVSAFGDAITITAMPLLVLFLTGSPGLMGLVLAMQVIPDLALALPAGALADRHDRRRMMLWSDVGRAVLTLAIPASFWLGGPTLAVVFVVTLPINALRVFSDTAFGSSLPRLVGRENLGRANSAMESVMSVPYIVGPAIGGVLVALVGAPTTLAIDAASFAFSAVAVLFVRRTLRADRPAERPEFLEDIRAGLTFVWRHVAIRTLIGYWAAIQVAIAGLIGTLGYYVTIERGLGPEMFGLLGSIWSVGYLVGSLTSSRQRQRASTQMFAAGVAIGVGIVATAVTAMIAVQLVAVFVVGGGLAVLFVAYATAQARATPDELMGRVGSTARMVTLGGRPIGILAAGAIVEGVGGGAGLIAMGGVVLVAAGVYSLTRAYRATPTVEPSAA